MYLSLPCLSTSFKMHSTTIKIVPVRLNPMWVDIQLHPTLTSAMEGGEWSASQPRPQFYWRETQFSPVHGVKTHKDTQRFSSTHSSPRYYTEVSGQHHVPATLPPGKNSGTNSIGGWADPSGGKDVTENRKNFSPSWIWTPDRPPPSLVTILS
jgi:hypothetical protein